ncbi:MAG: DUF423 domain-containing protein [Opitutales bacterium]|nr:DUF423 domain-containing protein [Opitutales bacterium]MCH8541309.1 DUF423 domain-containing protein [Opitutales bacterium]
MKESNRQQTALTVAAVAGALGVVAGALGAHTLAERLAESGHQQAWETAVLYQLVHAVALLAWHRRASLVQVFFWGGGIVCFSGSIYLLALGGPSFLGPITPIGGLLFMAGWLSLLKRPKPSA